MSEEAIRKLERFQGEVAKRIFQIPHSGTPTPQHVSHLAGIPSTLHVPLESCAFSIVLGQTRKTSAIVSSPPWLTMYRGTYKPRLGTQRVEKKLTCARTIQGVQVIQEQLHTDTMLR